MKAPAVTAFQSRVYQALGQIPRGKVTTYRLLAETLDCRSCQAVGQALKRNPFAPEVPCHRVIGSDLTPGGYAGARDGEKLARKRCLLREEGVHFDPATGKLTDPRQLHRFDA